MAGCWRAWCATREGQKALPLAAGTPRATGTRSPSGSLTLTRSGKGLDVLHEKEGSSQNGGSCGHSQVF
jgi:hypothetical protein